MIGIFTLGVWAKISTNGISSFLLWRACHGCWHYSQPAWKHQEGQWWSAGHDGLGATWHWRPTRWNTYLQTHQEWRWNYSLYNIKVVEEVVIYSRQTCRRIKCAVGRRRLISTMLLFTTYSSLVPWTPIVYIAKNNEKWKTGRIYDVSERSVDARASNRGSRCFWYLLETIWKDLQFFLCPEICDYSTEEDKKGTLRLFGTCWWWSSLDERRVSRD